MASATKKVKPPTFDLSKTKFTDYLWDLDAWKGDKSLDQNELARDIYNNLPAEDPTMMKSYIRNKMDKTNLGKKEGYDEIVRLMTERVGENTLYEIWDTFGEFEDTVRLADQTVEDFITFRELHYNHLLRLDDSAKMSPFILAMQLLKRSRLPPETQRMCFVGVKLANTDDFYKEIKANIRLLGGRGLVEGAKNNKI